MSFIPEYSACFLNRLEVEFRSPGYKQQKWGIAKQVIQKEKIALQARELRRLIREADADGDREVGDICAVTSSLLLRAPSEALPLEVEGAHSEVKILETKDGEVLQVTLSTRKNTKLPSVFKRACTCDRGGKELCALRTIGIAFIV